MKTSIARGVDGEQFLMFWCPGCDEAHGPIVRRVDPARPLWTWNGDREKPTLQPSIRVGGVVPLTDEEADRVLAGELIDPKPRVCHTYITDGRIQFLSDCTHALAGQTVEIPDWPYQEESDATAER